MKKLLILFTAILCILLFTVSCAPNYKTTSLYCEVGDSNIDLASSLAEDLGIKEGESVSLTHSNMDINTIGEYTAEFKITNEKDEAQILECIVYVEDNTAPQISFAENPISIMCDNGDSAFTTNIDSLIKSNIIATDNYDKDITNISYDIKGFNNSEIGSYDIVVTVTDSSYNSTSEHMTVNVLDNPYYSLEKAKKTTGLFVKTDDGNYIPVNKGSTLNDDQNEAHYSGTPVFKDYEPTEINNNELLVLFTDSSYNRLLDSDNCFYKVNENDLFYTIPARIDYCDYILNYESKLGGSDREYNSNYSPLINYSSTIISIDGYDIADWVNTSEAVYLFSSGVAGVDHYNIRVNTPRTVKITYTNSSNQLVDFNANANCLCYFIGDSYHNSNYKKPDYKVTGFEPSYEGYLIVDTSMLSPGKYIYQSNIGTYYFIIK